MRRVVLLLLVSLASISWAQADLPDAGLPDAAVGETGAERSSEEEDANLETPCLSSSDCDRGFVCTSGRCTYQRYRDAEFVGCGAAPGLALAGSALVLWVLRRSRR